MTSHARNIKLLIWAAKCHVHARRERTAGDLGALPHSSSEVQAAIDAIEALGFANEPSTDEGCRVYNR